MDTIKHDILHVRRRSLVLQKKDEARCTCGARYQVPCVHSSPVRDQIYGIFPMIPLRLKIIFQAFNLFDPFIMGFCFFLTALGLSSIIGIFLFLVL